MDHFRPGLDAKAPINASVHFIINCYLAGIDSREKLIVAGMCSDGLPRCLRRDPALSHHFLWLC